MALTVPSGPIPGNKEILGEILVLLIPLLLHTSYVIIWCLPTAKEIQVSRGCGEGRGYRAIVRGKGMRRSDMKRDLL